jgi:3-(3-hydroxy-phenyl)propionate hydroxylase
VNEFDADILIVGAGPTGLALSNALARLGSTQVIIEASETVSIHTKATNLMPGTLEQLDVYGLTDRMYATGGVMERYMIYMYGSNVGPRKMHLEESPHPNVLFLGQNLIEQNLKAAIPGHVSIRFSHRLVCLVQDEDGVKATIASNGTEKVMRFRYVVGCDGPRSATRKFSKCDFEPIKTGKYVWQADAKLKWTGLRSMKQMWLYYYDRGFGAVIHLPGDLTKVMVFEEKGELSPRLPTLEEIQLRLRAMSGDETATLFDPVWLSHGELLTGVAPALIDKRIILAGDACNPILPNGGQGLNIGIQDALNLAWKLHDVVKGYATPALLETYEIERRALRLALEKVQISTLKYTLPAPAFNRFVLRRFGNALLNRFWPFLAKAFSQLGLNYNKSPLTKDMMGKKGIRAGGRLLDADLIRQRDHAEVSLFQELCLPQWKLLLFDHGRALQDQPLTDDKLPWVKKIVISTARGHTKIVENLYYDSDRIAHLVYKITEPTLFLIRPDNYIALRMKATSTSELIDYLKKWYAPAMST